MGLFKKKLISISSSKNVANNSCIDIDFACTLTKQNVCVLFLVRVQCNQKKSQGGCINS